MFSHTFQNVTQGEYNDFESFPADQQNSEQNLPEHHLSEPQQAHQQQSFQPPELPNQLLEPLPDELVAAGLNSKIDKLRITAEFIRGLQTATLEKSNMSAEDIQCLRTPSSEFPDDMVNDRHFLKALRTFLATTDASEKTYDDVRAAHQACYPDDPYLSFYQIRRQVELLTGVTPIMHDMCVDSCVGFTGPFDLLDMCPKCSEPRYHTGTTNPRRQFPTIPIGPVIQALYRSETTAKLMHYLEEFTEQTLKLARENGRKIIEYTDTACGTDFLNAWMTGRFKKGDISLQLSIDGAQLYRDKESDCWIWIWIIHNLSPNLRYKKRFVIPGGFLGGPGKPKHTYSIIYPSLYHISALQREGLCIWDASTKSFINQSTLFLTLVTADGPAMANMNGMVGHSGKYGCRLSCGIPGRRRDGDGHYYPLMQKPDDYTVTGSDHPDVTFAQLKAYHKGISARYHSNLHDLLDAQNAKRYSLLRLSTGICKQSIFSGLHYTLGIPNIFVLDLMHLSAINDPDLLLSLWRGTIKCYSPDSKDTWDWNVLKGKVWDAHSKTVALSTPFLPSCFGRAPRNPAEKMNSGYKASEYLIYLFGLGPALLRFILPEHYWINYCKLVRGIQLLYQTKLAPEHIKEAHNLLCEFHQEFETFYIQRREDRIHFLRHSIHLLTHMAAETLRVGPLSCYAQWTMEIAIGNLGNEIHQDRNPYANIAERGILRAQINSIVAMLPHALLSQKESNYIPSGAIEVSDGPGYVLLRACQATLVDVSEQEAAAIMELWIKNDWPNQDGWPRAVCRWARLRLPNGQIARSIWMESRSHQSLRKTCIIKVELNHMIYFFISEIDLTVLQWKQIQFC